MLCRSATTDNDPRGEVKAAAQVFRESFTDTHKTDWNFDSAIQLLEKHEDTRIKHVVGLLEGSQQTRTTKRLYAASRKSAQSHGVVDFCLSAEA